MLVDAAAGRLAMDSAPSGHGVATADLTIHYLDPITSGPARAVASMVCAGRRLIIVGVEVLMPDPPDWPPGPP